MIDLPVDRVHTLENFLDMYHFKDEEVLICESFANAQDVFIADKIKKPTIEITLEKAGPDVGYINIHNNATPMNEKQFQNYHKISGSVKVKGGGIGFAGVGAKVFLASNIGGEIFTITGKNNSDFFSSRMVMTKDNVQYEKNLSLSEIFGNKTHKHQYGTTYRVRVNKQGYNYFKERLSHIVQFWWNHSLLKKHFTVIVDGKEVKPFDPVGQKFKKSFQWKKHKIECYCWITRSEIPIERRHVVYAVHGKRITNEIISQPINLKSDFYNRVFCLVDVTHLSKHIAPDKESFHTNWETNQTKQAAQKFFIEFLSEEGLLGNNTSTVQTTEIVNEFTKELDKLLKTKAFKDLNPFLSARKRMVPTPDENGDFPLSEIEGGEGQGSGESGNGGEQGGEGQGEEQGGDGKTFVEDDEGGRAGKHIEKKSKGIRIIPTEEFPNEKEEAWVDLKKGAVCLNVLHPFYQIMVNSDKCGKFEQFNIRRLLIESLIKFKNDELKENWDPAKTLNMYRDLLHKTWSG